MWPFKRKKRAPQSPPERAFNFHRNSPCDRSIREHLELGERVQTAPASKQFKIAQKQIGMSTVAAKAFRDVGWEELPSHPGFRRVAVDLERQGDFDGAISSSRGALGQGWSGDWEKRIERCEAKISNSRKRR